MQLARPFLVQITDTSLTDCRERGNQSSARHLIHCYLPALDSCYLPSSESAYSGVYPLMVMAETNPGMMVEG